MLTGATTGFVLALLCLPCKNPASVQVPFRFCANDLREAGLNLPGYSLSRNSSMSARLRGSPTLRLRTIFSEALSKGSRASATARASSGWALASTAQSCRSVRNTGMDGSQPYSVVRCFAANALALDVGLLRMFSSTTKRVISLLLAVGGAQERTMDRSASIMVLAA